MRCRSAAEQEPLAGSAPRALTWWLIEVPGSWGKRAVEACRIAAVSDLRSDDQRRVLLIRRPGHHPATPVDSPVRIWTSRGVGGPIHSLRMHPENIATADSAPNLDAWACEPTPDEPRLLICTNAARDACCGIDGRALVQDLGGHPGVWECSHLGGHRFAPTALHVTQGMVYGRLTADTAHRLIDSDTADPQWADVMRGSPGLSPQLQAASITLLRDYGRLPDSLSLREDGIVAFTLGDISGLLTISRQEVGTWPVSCGGPVEAASGWHVRAVNPT